MKTLLPSGDTLPMRVHLLARYARARKPVLVGSQSMLQPNDNPIWATAQKEAAEWWLILAPSVHLAQQLAKLWPRRTYDPKTGSRVVSHKRNR